MSKLHTLALLSTATAALTSTLAAQSTTATPTAGETVQMDRFEVSGVPIEQQILPTSRPVNSVYGTDRNVLDTPRNVTIISREQMNVIGIQDVRSFSQLTASSYTQTNFGLPSNPSIRGQIADVLVNGMRRGLTVNGNGMPVNFNAVESVNIVKGTANVIYGATSYAGGYSDFITKKPYFDKVSGMISVTAGSYDTNRWTVDVGGPISPELAYRISYSGENTEGYYYNGKKNTQALYGAIEWRPNSTYTLELNAEYFEADVTENWGINRVTQQLIDDGLYIPDAITNAAYITSLQTLGGFGNPVQPYGTPVKLDRRVRLLAPGDDSYGINVTAQAIQTFKFDSGARIVNNTFYNYIDRDTFSSYYYNSVHRDNFGLENRLQIQHGFEQGTIKHSYSAGVSMRHQKVWAVDDFYHEPVNSFDLTRDPNLNRVPVSAFGGFNASVLIPGEGPRGILPGRYGTPGASYGFDPATGNIYNGNGSSNDSRLDQLSPFYQHDVVFNDHFSLLAGGRVDFLDVSNVDPLPPKGYTAVSDEISVKMPSYNLSPVYKINDRLTAYYTYSFATSAYSGLGGGYAFLDSGYVSDTNRFHKFQFDQENTLHEVGLKGSFLGNKLFIGTALYEQSQDWTTGDTAATKRDRYIESKGFEIEFNYQPNKQLFATFSYSYFDSVQRYAGFLADSVTYDQRRSGVAAPITPDFPTISEEFQQPGVPEHLINFLVNYKFDLGLSVSAGTVITGPIVTSQEGAGTALGAPIRLTANEIPWQYTTNVTLAYSFGKWDTRLALNNVTDEKNWSAPNPGYGNGSINAELPFTAEFTVALRF